MAENASGASSARLAVDTAAIRGAVGDQLGALTQEIVTFIAGALLPGPGRVGPTLILPHMFCVPKVQSPYIVSVLHQAPSTKHI